MARESFRPSPADRVKLQVVETDDSPVLVDLDGKEAPVIRVIDDTPEDQRGSTRDPSKWPDANEGDPKDLGARGQKRWDRLKAESETEKRLRLQTERERDEAIRVAKLREDEVNDLRSRLSANTTSLATSMTAERDTRIADATRRLEQAHAEGNSGEIAKATADLTSASAERAMIIANTPRQQPQRQEPEQRQPAPQQQQNAAPRLHPDVVAWVSRTPRFNKDDGFTRTAMAIDSVLAAQGIRPGAPNYIAEVDKRLQAEYPDHQPTSGSQSDDGDDEERTTAPRRTNAVAPGSRDTRPSGGPRTVELTATEYAVARQLGLTTPKQLALYAAEKQKRDQNGKGAQ